MKMERNRQSKIIAIVALCVAVVGLTLGFAAFSNTLTIQSSATVTPDKSDFKMTVYGMENKINISSLTDPFTELAPLSLYTSKTLAAPILENDNVDATIAVIDNEKISMTNLITKFTEPGQRVMYWFVIKNEGNYDAYINVKSISLSSAKCTAGENTSADLVNSACDGIISIGNFGVLNENNIIDPNIDNYLDENGYLKVPIGKHIYVALTFEYEYDAVRADGPFSVEWEDIVVEFKSTDS